MVSIKVLPFLFSASLIAIVYARNYIKFNHEYAKLEEVNAKYLKVTDFNFYKRNRTAKALNATFTLLTDLTVEHNLEVHVAALMFLSNQFRTTPILMHLNICKLVNQDKFDVKGILKGSDIKECPISKGKHYINNIAPTAEGWPNIPQGKYKIVLEFKFNRTISLAKMYWITEISKNE